MPEYDVISAEIGERGQLTPRNAKTVAFQWSLVLLNTLNSEHRLFIGGYDDDPRSLWEIPEAREYVRHFAGWVCARTGRGIDNWCLDQSSLAMVTLCCDAGKVVAEHKGGMLMISLDKEKAYIQRPDICA